MTDLELETKRRELLYECSWCFFLLVLTAPAITEWLLKPSNKSNSILVRVLKWKIHQNFGVGLCQSVARSPDTLLPELAELGQYLPN